MKELVFEIRDAEEGGYNARALGEAIFTQAETWEELKQNILEAIDCYYDSVDEQPKIVQLHYVRNELMLVKAA
jgi:predicted RNase H-like HicB family nuclease